MAAAMTKATTALDPMAATAVPDSEKMPAAIIVPRPIANAILKSSVRVCCTIARMYHQGLIKSPEMALGVGGLNSTAHERTLWHASNDSPSIQ
jgi:hypothetical protein